MLTSRQPASRANAATSSSCPKPNSMTKSPSGARRERDARDQALHEGQSVVARVERDRRVRSGRCRATARRRTARTGGFETMTSTGPWTGSSRSPRTNVHASIDPMPRRRSWRRRPAPRRRCRWRRPARPGIRAPARPRGSRCRCRRRRSSARRRGRAALADGLDDELGFGPGMSTSGETSKSSPQNSRWPVMKATGSCVARRSMSAARSADRRRPASGRARRRRGARDPSRARAAPALRRRAWRSRPSARRARALRGRQRFVRVRRSMPCESLRSASASQHRSVRRF